MTESNTGNFGTVKEPKGLDLELLLFLKRMQEEGGEVGLTEVSKEFNLNLFQSKVLLEGQVLNTLVVRTENEEDGRHLYTLHSRGEVWLQMKNGGLD